MPRKITEPVNINSRRVSGTELAPATSHPSLAEARQSLEDLISTVNLKKIVKGISGEKPVGRNKLPREPMVRAHIVGRMRGIPTIKGLVRELNDNPAMGELCGFDVIDYTGRLPVYHIPSRRTFGRVFRELRQPGCRKLIEECMAELTIRQIGLKPDSGEHIAIDSTTIRTYSNRWSGTDLEASPGFKHSVKSASGTEMVLGYKFHTIAYTDGNFITGIFTTGSQHDSPVLSELVKKARRMLGDRFDPQSASADKGYDSRANHGFLHSEGIAPLIPLRRMLKRELLHGKYTDDGVPTCDGLVMEYVSTDIETGKHLYRCPVEDHIPEGQMLPCAGEVEVGPTEDIRLFGGAIRRGAPKWDEGYKGRYGVERLYAWWKVGLALEGHYFRGKANIELHTLLTALAYQARQITRLRGMVVDLALRATADQAPFFRSRRASEGVVRTFQLRLLYNPRRARESPCAALVRATGALFGLMILKQVSISISTIH